jgi:cbb3-type cytochrome oxidase subunit 3
MKFGELMAQSPLLVVPIFVLFLFLFMFTAVFFLTMRRRASAYDPLARIPLDDELRAKGDLSS